MHRDIVIAMQNRAARACAVIAIAVAIPVALAGQDRLKATPGYAVAQRISREAPLVSGGALTVTWTDGGRAFEYARGGKHFHYDVERKAAAEILEPAASARSEQAGRSG